MRASKTEFYQNRFSMAHTQELRKSLPSGLTLVGWDSWAPPHATVTGLYASV